jgi:two-component SAPR family response regulator
METIVLIIGNNENLNYLISSSLIKKGYNNVKITLDENEIIKNIESYIKPIIFIDLDFFNPKNTISLVEKMKHIKDVPVVLLTNRFDKNHIDLQEINPVGYLSIPPTKSDVINIAKLAFSRYLPIIPTHQIK